MSRNILSFSDQSIQRFSVWATITITTLLGLIALLQPLGRRLPLSLHLALLPLRLYPADVRFHILLGFTLLYCAYQLSLRKVLAWWATLLVFVTTLLLAAQSYHSLVLSLLLIPTIALLVTAKPYFKARIERNSVKRGMMALAASLLIALVYGWVGFELLDVRDFGIDFNSAQSVARTVREFTLVGNPDLIPRTHFARDFLLSLDFIGILALAYGLTSLFSPIRWRFQVLPRERQLARELLEQLGDHNEGYLKLWPQDKQYFFTSSGEGFLAYRVEHGAALVVGNPVASSHNLPGLLAEFGEYTHSNGWLTAFLLASEELLPIYRDAGFREVKIGEDALVDLEAFAGSTGRNKYFRNIINRFGRQGYGLEKYQPPHSPRLIQEVRRVSNAWMTLEGKHEWGFLQGYFDTAYLQSSPLYILRSGDGLPVAFANQVPTYVSGQATIDLMRHLPDAPTNTMDFLLASIMLELKSQGFTTFNLGMTPLAGLKQAKNAGVEEVLLRQFAPIMNRWIVSVQGLRRFKAKFEPQWHSQYVVYEGPPTNLVPIGIALTRAVRR